MFFTLPQEQQSRGITYQKGTLSGITFIYNRREGPLYVRLRPLRRIVEAIEGMKTGCLGIASSGIMNYKLYYIVAVIYV